MRRRAQPGIDTPPRAAWYRCAAAARQVDLRRVAPSSLSPVSLSSRRRPSAPWLHRREFELVAFSYGDTGYAYAGLQVWSRHGRRRSQSMPPLMWWWHRCCQGATSVAGAVRGGRRCCERRRLLLQGPAASATCGVGLCYF
jgi:hypothetical protein